MVVKYLFSEHYAFAPCAFAGLQRTVLLVWQLQGSY